MSGCVTTRPSKIPYFLEEIDRFEFEADEKEVIGKMLYYINELENE